MEYLLVLLLGFLATSKMSFQTAFSKKSVKNSLDALSFNIFVFMTPSVLFVYRVFDCSPQIWLYATVSAVITIAYQLFYTKALSIGNVSMTVLMTNFSMVINVLVSYFVFGDPISFVRFVGICLTVVSFVICNSVGESRKKTDKQWLLFTVLAMVANSGGSIMQKIFGESPYSGENQAYISCMYIVATVVSVIMYQFMKRKEIRQFKIGFCMIKFAFAVGFSLAVYQLIYTYSLANIDGTFLFPAQTGAIIIFSTLSGILFFKDKFTKNQLVGIITGVISLILMNY